MEVIDHNGIDVRGRDAVLKAHEALTRAKDEYGIGPIHNLLTSMEISHSTLPIATATGGSARWSIWRI